MGLPFILCPLPRRIMCPDFFAEPCVARQSLALPTPESAHAPPTPGVAGFRLARPIAAATLYPVVSLPRSGAAFTVPMQAGDYCCAWFRPDCAMLEKNLTVTDCGAA